MFPDWSEDYGDREAYDLNPFTKHESRELFREATRVEAPTDETPVPTMGRFEDLSLYDLRLLHEMGIDSGLESPADVDNAL